MMADALLFTAIGLGIVNLILLFIIYKKIANNSSLNIGNLFGDALNKTNERMEKLTKDELGRNRDEIQRQSKENRQEMNGSFKSLGEQMSDRMNEMHKIQKEQLSQFSDQLKNLTQSNEQKFEKLIEKVEKHLKEIQESNANKLDEMRQTVDEKLHSTLEKRLGESFKLVSERLELVHKGLGEMQNLASGVGDLKRVLTNVKTRGTWGEIQLGNLIEQMLTPDQYAKNVATKPGSRESVEFAVKLPGKNDSKDETVWLPIDAKFPMEDYQRLLEAQDAGDLTVIEQASVQIERRIKDEAKKIAEKYVSPPSTTDFAIMFLPIEGLYAEILRKPGLADSMQRDHRIIITGPTNLAALLNSLQMGFRTLAIEKRSSEVWKLLGAVKTDFSKFRDILEKTQTKLDQASKSIGDATKKTKTIERRLRDVQELPPSEQLKLLQDLDE